MTEDDWRLNGQEAYLANKALGKFIFHADDECDHGLCAFCWTKISEQENDPHVGYATLDGMHVICEECYADFKERFRWTIEKRLGEQTRVVYQRRAKKKICDGLQRVPPVSCIFCERPLEEKGQTGYCTEDEAYWMCDTCFPDFKDIYELRFMEP